MKNQAADSQGYVAAQSQTWQGIHQCLIKIQPGSSTSKGSAIALPYVILESKFRFAAFIQFMKRNADLLNINRFKRRPGPSQVRKGVGKG